MDVTIIDGIRVFPFASAQQLIDYVVEHPSLLVAINAEKILHATPDLRALYNRNIGYADGAGAVFALRQKGELQAVKIAGCDLWLQLVERLHAEKSFYLVGGRPEVMEETVLQLRKTYPHIRIVGHRDGYLKEGDEERLIADVARLQPDVVFVAMGSPRQERLMERMQEQHPTAIYQGLGGSFDVYTGRVARAPQWWIRHNLEFAYRLIKQPSRIKRQIHLLRFLFKIYTHQI